MKKIISIALLSLIIVGLLAACSSPAAAPAANLAEAYPAADQQAAAPAVAYPAADQQAAAPAVAYPAADQQAAAPAVAQTAYPVEAVGGAKLSDEQVLALIEKQLNGHHTMDFLLGQKLNHDQWVEVLGKSEHSDVTFTPDELEQVIAYLIAHQK